MYAYLQGTVIEKAAMSVVIDVGGVGYQIQIPLSTYQNIPALGQTVKLLTHFAVREDAHMLFGFATEEEREIFKLLLSVSGIGPKLALTVLSGIPVSQLKQAIVEGQLETLKKIAGIGKKTAERLIVELREKLVLTGQPSSDLSGIFSKEDIGLVEDSLEALVALGYRKQNAKVAIEKVFKNGKPGNMSVEDLIRASLKYV